LLEVYSCLCFYHSCSFWNKVYWTLGII